MSTVAEIKAAIDQFSPQERWEPGVWRCPFENGAGDERMKRDAPGQRIPLTEILTD